MTDQMVETPTASAMVVARIPVVDATRTIVGFELVGRATLDPATPDPLEGREPVVTVSGLLGAIDVDLSAVVGNKLLFCRVDRAVLVSGTPLSLPPRRSVLEVPADDVDDEVLTAVGALKRAGFTIMVRHGGPGEQSAALLDLVDLVKIDVGQGTPPEVMDVVDGYRGADVELVAAGCDTESQLLWARAAGFDLFAGIAVRVPETPSSSTTTAPLPLSQVQMGLELLSEDLDFDRIEDIVRGDPALVVQLLNMASAGAGGGLRRQVRSLREALVVLGTVRLRQWAALVILSRHCQRQSDALVTALARARMCELLARSRGIDAPFAFTAGLLSVLHVMLGVPASEIRQQVRVDEDLAGAAFRQEGVVGELIRRAETHERWIDEGSRPGADEPEVGIADHDHVTMIGAMAFAWAASHIQSMDSAVQA